MKERKTLLHKFVCFLLEKTLGLKSFSNSHWVKVYLFLKSYVTSEKAISYTVVYYQQLPIIDLYQVSLRANICFEHEGTHDLSSDQ